MKANVYDVKKELKNLYAPRNTDWALIDVPALGYLAVDGEGDPNKAKAYGEAVEALYTVAYTLRFADRQRPFVVGPLEGLWWADDLATFVTREKAAWKWRMLIVLPPWLSEAQLAPARQQALAKKKLGAIERVRFVELHEGTCAQLLHLGSYDDEGPKLAELHGQYLAENGLQCNGLHHEIYLSDPRRVDPAKLKTILRQPVKPAPARVS